MQRDNNKTPPPEKPPKKPGGRSGAGFTKGDPRINRKGRPKSFDALRALAQSIGAETVPGKNGEPIVIEGHLVTQAERALRDLLQTKPEKFLEVAYGKTPLPIEISGGDKPLRVQGFDYAASIAPIAPRPVPDSHTSGETANSGDGAALGEDANGE